MVCGGAALEIAPVRHTKYSQALAPERARMVNTVPAVSVAMPVYNGAPYVREAVASLLAQTCTDFELVIVDDGSTDATPEILKDAAAHDPRVVIHRQSNGGHTAA